jgi:hypothetical protein
MMFTMPDVLIAFIVSVTLVAIVDRVCADESLDERYRRDAQDDRPDH